MSKQLKIVRQTLVRRNQIKGRLIAHLPKSHCPLCGGRCRFTAANWLHAYLQCAKCGLIFTSSLPSLADLSRSYAQVENASYQIRHKTSWKDWLTHKELTLNELGIAPISKHLHHRQLALDIGCGEGYLLELLDRFGYHAEGIDLNPSFVRTSNQRGNKASVASVEQIPLDGHFDLVTMFHVVEHLRDPFEALTTIASKINPGGSLIVETPLSLDRENTDHLYCFSASALEMALTSVGMTPIRWFDYIDANYHHHNLACRAIRETDRGSDPARLLPKR